MTTRYLPFEDDLTVEQNIINLLDSEIRKTTSLQLLAYRSPFVYINTVKRLVFVGKLGVVIRNKNRKAFLLDRLMAIRELDHTLMANHQFAFRRVSPNEFSDYIITKMFNSNSALVLLRED